MPRHTVPADQLREGTVIKVSGKIGFSRVSSVIDGAELEKQVQRQTARGMKYPTKVPHTTITLVDPVVQATGPNGVMTPEETYVSENVYDSTTGANAGHKGFSIDTIGTRVPTIIERQADGSYAQVQPAGELARGLDVTLVINVFKSREYENRGLGVVSVVVNEPIRTFGGNSVADALAKAGITVIGQLVTPTPAPVSFEDLQTAAEQYELPGPFEPAVASAPDSTVIETQDQMIERLAMEKAAAIVAAQQGRQPTVGSPWDVEAKAA